MALLLFPRLVHLGGDHGVGGRAGSRLSPGVTQAGTHRHPLPMVTLPGAAEAAGCRAPHNPYLLPPACPGPDPPGAVGCPPVSPGLGRGRLRGGRSGVHVRVPLLPVRSRPPCIPGFMGTFFLSS